VAGVAQSIRREELREMVQALASGAGNAWVVAHAPHVVVDAALALLAEIDRRCGEEQR